MTTRLPLHDLAVVIQAGGESKRMGQSKASVPFLGEPLICRSVSRLASLSDEMIITTNEPGSLAFLLTDDAYPPIRFAEDVLRKRSSMNGLLTALTSTDRDYIALAACDMICVSEELLLHAYELMAGGDYDAVIPLGAGGLEPFHGVYHRQRMLAQVNSAIAKGDMRIIALLERSQICRIPFDEVLAYAPRGDCFDNLNTPEQLAYFEQRERHTRHEALIDDEAQDEGSVRDA